MKPMLTIVVPLYNSADTMDQLIAELIQLPVPGGHELVLVNDGSADATAEIAARWVARTDLPDL